MDAERFTESALQTVASAQEIARVRHQQNIVPAHLGAALLADPQSPASRVVERAGGDLGQVQAALDTALNKLPKVSGGSGQYMSPEIARVFDEAERTAKDWGDSFVAADALLVALRTIGGDGVTALPDAKALREAAQDIRGGRTVDTKTAESSFEALEKYGIDLTKLAHDGKLDPVIGRDEEVRRAIQILLRRTKNNPVLIGEPGVGKTAIAEGFSAAHRQKGRARGPAGQAHHPARHGLASSRREVPRRI